MVSAGTPPVSTGIPHLMRLKFIERTWNTEEEHHHEDKYDEGQLITPMVAAGLVMIPVRCSFSERTMGAVW